MAQILVQDANNYGRDRSINDGIKNTTPICQC
uniref:Uncharacterized protein MANES_09G123600 n=1 Tax=Rhizophora mucronata TaxID=61149 RepID=A0A2P2JS02_RHIMU